MPDPAPSVEGEATASGRGRSPVGRLLFATITLGSWVLFIGVTSWFMPRLVSFWEDFDIQLPAAAAMLVDHWTLLTTGATVLLLALLIVGEVLAGVPAAARILRVLALLLAVGFAVVVIVVLFAPLPEAMMSVM